VRAIPSRDAPVGVYCGGKRRDPTKKDAKTDTTSTDVIAFMIVTLPLR
jgi:hypothetical protein